MSHTPGPWTFRADGDDSHYAIMAGTRWLASFLHNGEQWTDTQLANARLMAAAPDMLTALREIAGLLDGPVVSEQSRSAARAAALIAIRRASGE